MLAVTTRNRLLSAAPPRAGRLFGVTARLEGGRGLAAPLEARRRLRAEAEGNPDLVRWTIGLYLPPSALISGDRRGASHPGRPGPYLQGVGPGQRRLTG